MRQSQPPARYSLATYDEWVTLARQLVEPALEHQTPALSEIRLPGSASWHGERADGLEAFCRVLLLDSLAGCQEPLIGASTVRLLDGIAVGVGDTEQRWIRATGNRHALVEAVSLCLSLWFGEHRLWRALPEPVQRAVVVWLSECADLHPTLRNNWVLFAFTINRFLSSIGQQHPESELIESHARERLDELYRGDGWYSDDGPATFDYYNSFAFHFFPGLVAHLSGDRRLLTQSAERLAAFLPSLEALIAPDGSPVYFGRSMTYRCAVATPLSMASLLGITDPAPAMTRDATARVIGHFTDIGGIVPGSPLAPGWGSDDVDLVQHYSGPGSAYWAAQVFVNLLLPREHPYWQPAPEVKDEGLRSRRIEIPGFLVVSSASIVRLSNHGSYDTNATDIQERTDDPFYARLAYSSDTLPLVGDGADNAVTVSSGERRFRRGRIAATGGGDDWAASDGWLRDLDSGAELELPARFCTVSVGGWDIHFVSVPPAKELRDVTVSLTGWACGDLLDSDINDTVTALAVTLSSTHQTTELHGMLGFSSARVLRGSRPNSSWALAEVTGGSPGRVFAASTSLRRNAESGPGATPAVSAQPFRRWRLRVPGYGDRSVTLGATGFSVS